MKQYNKSVRGKLFKYFEQRLHIKKSTKGWYRCDCIYCHSKFTMAIHLQYNRIKCFKCEVETDPIKLLITLENLKTYQEAWNFLKIQEEFEFYNEDSFEVRDKVEVKLPEAYSLLFSKPKNLLGKIAFEYLTKTRKFKPEILGLKGVGYCNRGEYNGYIIFPYYKAGKLIFFQGRKYSESGFTKMKNPPTEAFGVGKSEILYNEDALYIYKTVYLVESITNALTLGDKAIAGSGKKFSITQINKIITSPVKNLIIILDEDAIIDAYELALSFCQIKNVKVVKMPKEKDVNDLGKRETLIRVHNSQYRDYNYFYKMKLKYEQSTINPFD